MVAYCKDQGSGRGSRGLGSGRTADDLGVSGGYDEEAVLGIMGGNFLRVAAAVWR